MIKGVIKANTYINNVVDLSLKQLGKDYIHGHMGPDTFDCAGLVWYVYNFLYGINIFEGGYGLSTTTMIMTGNYGKLTLFDSINKNIKLINKGDIVLLHRQSKQDNEPRCDNKYPGHCGIYLGDGTFIHASGSVKKVVINSFDEEYWKKILVGSKTIIDDNKKYFKK